MTQHNNNDGTFKFFNFNQFFEKLNFNPYNLNDLLEMQRKNLQALNEARQIALENVQAISQKQAELVSALIEKRPSVNSEMTTAENALSQNAERIKQSYETAIKNAAEIAEMVKKANAETTSILNKRASANFREIRNCINDNKDRKAG